MPVVIGQARSAPAFRARRARSCAAVINRPVGTRRRAVATSIGVGTSIAGTVAANNSFHRNRGSVRPFLFYIDGTASGTQVFCDNVVVPPTQMGTSCIP